MYVRIFPVLDMTGIFRIFIFGCLFLTNDGIHFYMCEARLRLPHCMAEAPPCSALLPLGHEACLITCIGFLHFLYLLEPLYLLDRTLLGSGHIFLTCSTEGT